MYIFTYIYKYINLFPNLLYFHYQNAIQKHLQRLQIDKCESKT